MFSSQKNLPRTTNIRSGRSGWRVCFCSFKKSNSRLESRLLILRMKIVSFSIPLNSTNFDQFLSFCPDAIFSLKVQQLFQLDDDLPIEIRHSNHLRMALVESNQFKHQSQQKCIWFHHRKGIVPRRYITISKVEEGVSGARTNQPPHPSSWLAPHPTHPSIADRMSGLPKNKLAVWLVSNCDTKRWLSFENNF